MVMTACSEGNKTGEIFSLLSQDSIALDTAYYQVTEKTERNTWDPVIQQHIPKYYIGYSVGGGETKRIPVPGGKTQWLGVDRVMVVTEIENGRLRELRLISGQ